MIQLPIASRELRIAARKRSTFWIRLTAVLVASVIAAGFMVLARIGFPGGPRFGTALLGTLSWLAFIATVMAGVFLTSDSLSEEKREGTLGLLFLTNLRGFDVTSGKLLATSLRGFYAFLAILPVLSVTLLLGGVTGLQILRVSLALINSLFASLCAGLLVSAVSRNGQRAMSGTFLLILFLNVSGPLLDIIIRLNGWQGPTRQNYFSLCSPWFVFSEGLGAAPGSFWRALLVNLFISWTFFALASLILPRSWQDKKSGAGQGQSAAWLYRWKYGGPAYRTTLRARLLELNPAVWLVCRERWQSSGIWALATVFASLLILVVFMGGGVEVWMGGSFFASLGTYGLYIWAAAWGPRFLVEARHSGLLELMLASPLEVNRIINGQWHGFLRMFGAPVIVLLLVCAVVGGFAQQGTFGGMAGPQTLPTWVMVAVGAAASLLTTAGNLAALIWFGIWAGLTSRNTNMAALKTLVLVQVAPVFVLGLASGLVTVLVMFPAMMAGAGGPSANVLEVVAVLLFPVLLAVAKNFLFISWSRRNLYRTFRERASRSTRNVAAIPALIRTPGTPPVIAALPNS